MEAEADGYPPFSDISLAGNQAHHGDDCDEPSRQATCTSYKLISDPYLVTGVKVEWIVRHDGVVRNDPTFPPVVVRDPRKQPSDSSRFWKKPPLIMPVPNYVIDSNYVGKPPPLQVTITNVNDNISKSFLAELLQKYGKVDDLHVYYHPVTKKHLGLAYVLFHTTQEAKLCVEKLNKTKLMGQTLNVFLDPCTKRCDVIVEELVGAGAGKKSGTGREINGIVKVENGSNHQNNWMKKPQVPFLEKHRIVYPITPKTPNFSQGDQVDGQRRAKGNNCHHYVSQGLAFATPTASYSTSQGRHESTAFTNNDTVIVAESSPISLTLDDRINNILENPAEQKRFFGLCHMDTQGDNVNGSCRSLSFNKNDIWDCGSTDSGEDDEMILLEVKGNNDNESACPPPSPYLESNSSSGWQEVKLQKLQSSFNIKQNGNSFKF